MREWECAHYGMHGGSSTPVSGLGDRRTSDMAREAQRKARAWRDNAKGRAPPRQATFGQLVFVAAAFTTVWMLVMKTAKSSYNPYTSVPQPAIKRQR